jgi:hypothetical protein
VEVVQAVATARLGPVMLKAIDDAGGNEEGRDLLGRMRLQVFVVCLLDGLESAHAGAHENADAVRVRIRHDESGVAHGLHARHHAVLHEAIHSARILGCHVRLQIELPNLAAEMRGEIAGIETRHRADAAAPGDDRGPGAGHVVADRRDNSKTGDDGASLAQPRLLMGFCMRG